jgi:hypothetical protein
MVLGLCLFYLIIITLFYQREASIDNDQDPDFNKLHETNEFVVGNVFE